MKQPWVYMCSPSRSIYFFLTRRKLSFSFWLHHVACGILVPWPGIKPTSPAWKDRVLTLGHQGSPQLKFLRSSLSKESFCGREYEMQGINYSKMCVWAKSLQSRPTLCDSTDHNQPDTSVRGVLQARILKWAAMHSSRRSSWLRDWTHISSTGRQVLYH